MVLSAIAEHAPVVKRRRPWLASFLSLPLSGLGQLYNGDARRGGIFFASELVLTFAAVLLLKPATTFMGMVLWFTIPICWKSFVIIDAWRGAKVAGTISLRRYNRWWAYIGIMLLGSALFAPVREIRNDSTQSFSIQSGSDLPNLRPGERIMAIGKPPFAIARGDVVIFPHPKPARVGFVA
jgi:signal peptidase I